jgi:putative FmdB family regulatory protein
MPLYEYQCDQCSHRFERIQKFSDPPIDVCPSCGGSVRKLLSSPAIQFKGSGWYITDYARKSSTDTNKNSGSSSSGGTSDSSSSTSSGDKDKGTSSGGSTGSTGSSGNTSSGSGSSS